MRRGDQGGGSLKPPLEIEILHLRGRANSNIFVPLRGQNLQNLKLFTDPLGSQYLGLSDGRFLTESRYLLYLILGGSNSTGRGGPDGPGGMGGSGVAARGDRGGQPRPHSPCNFWGGVGMNFGLQTSKLHKQGAASSITGSSGQQASRRRRSRRRRRRLLLELVFVIFI